MMRPTTFTVCIALATSTTLAQVSDVVFFGDSLSDVGNVDALTVGILPGNGYFDGRFSNGALFTEYLASDLGLSAPINSLAGGDNFAFGGAGAAGNNFLGVIPSVENQVGTYLGANTPTGDELFVVWGGSNDIINGDADATDGVASSAIIDSVSDLAQAGAAYIAVINLTPLGEVPRFLGTPEQAGINNATVQFNNELTSGLVTVQSNFADTDIIEIDLFSAFGNILENPAVFGLTNVTDAALDVGLGFDEADQYAFWDDLHPTTAGHRLVADEVFAALPASVSGIPEPGIAGFALAGLLLRRRR